MIDHFPMNAHLTTKSFKTKPITSNKKWNNKLGFFCLDSDFLKSHFLTASSEANAVQEEVYKLFFFFQKPVW